MGNNEWRNKVSSELLELSQLTILNSNLFAICLVLMALLFPELLRWMPVILFIAGVMYNLYRSHCLSGGILNRGEFICMASKFFIMKCDPEIFVKYLHMLPNSSKFIMVYDCLYSTCLLKKHNAP
jgi:hypothetical protein